MKYIILLISFSFAQVIAPIGMGEAKIDTVEYMFEYLIDAQIDSGEVVAKELTNVKIINRPITLNDYLDYAEECYNDSVYDMIARNEVKILGQIFYEIDYGWTHPTTPTLPGFIEWLKGE